MVSDKQKLKSDKQKLKSVSNYKLLNNSDVKTMDVDEYFKTTNSFNGTDTIVLKNNNTKEIYFLNGNIALNFMERERMAATSGKSLKEYNFTIVFFDGESEFKDEDGNPKSYKGIRGIRLGSRLPDDVIAQRIFDF